MKTENAWKKYADKTEVFAFSEAYKEFIRRAPRQSENVLQKWCSRQKK